jgi:hypothetical protein
MQTRTAAAGQPLDGVVVPEGAPAFPSRISWGSVLAGAVVAVALGVMLNVLGVAIGLSTIDPAVPGETPAASTLGSAGGIWVLVTNLLALGAGGWVAARLSGTADGTDGALHGLSVWAVGLLLSAVLVGNLVSGTTSTVVSGASSALGTAVQGAGQAAQAIAPQIASATDPEALVQRLQQGLQTGGEPAQMTQDQRRAEIARILGERLRQGSFQGEQRDRLAQLVAAESGIPAQEAEARIQQLEARASEAAARAETQAREAAEAAANTAATGSYLIFGAMLLGAVAAVVGARIGTRRTARLHGYA